jgi:hypothetical protein
LDARVLTNQFLIVPVAWKVIKLVYASHRIASSSLPPFTQRVPMSINPQPVYTYTTKVAVASVNTEKDKVEAEDWIEIELGQSVCCFMGLFPSRH